MFLLFKQRLIQDKATLHEDQGGERAVISQAIWSMSFGALSHVGQEKAVVAYEDSKIEFNLKYKVIASATR